MKYTRVNNIVSNIAGSIVNNAVNNIVVGDCLDVMRQMPDGCVDLVVTKC